MKARLLGLLAGTAVLALSSTFAQAADLPARTMAPAPAPFVAPVPAFTWAGMYVGVNAGWGWDDDDDDDFLGGGAGTYAVPLLGGGVATYTLANPNTFVGNGNNDGFVGGAQIGFNFQPTPGAGFVWGVEADIQGVWNDDDDDDFIGTGPTFYAVAPTAAAVTAPGFGVAPALAGAPGNLALFEQRGAFGRNGLDWFSTLRLRAGFAFDRVLIYATGGLAFGEGGDNNFVASTGANIRAPFFVSPAAARAGAGVTNGGAFDDDDDISWGWTLGAGVEFAVTNNLTFKLEGLWVDLDEDNNVFGTDVAGVTNTGAPVRRTDAGFGFDDNDNSDFFVVRGGLNFKFNTF